MRIMGQNDDALNGPENNVKMQKVLAVYAQYFCIKIIKSRIGTLKNIWHFYSILRTIKLKR